MERVGLRRLLFVAPLLALAWALGAIAQTPDDQTPAAELVCNELQDAQYTPGLYGLCVAFCEALDAETQDPLGMCNVAPIRILDNYNRLRTKTDPPMPCLKPLCPCFDAADLDGVFKGCTVGFFPSGVDCFYLDLNGPGIAQTYILSLSKGPFCYFGGKNSAVPITLEQAHACLALLEEYKPGACILSKMMCEK